jgi:hypothetical protein
MNPLIGFNNKDIAFHFDLSSGFDLMPRTVRLHNFVLLNFLMVMKTDFAVTEGQDDLRSVNMCMPLYAHTFVYKCTLVSYIVVGMTELLELLIMYTFYNTNVYLSI